MPPAPRGSATKAMEADVLQMEARLSSLRATMSAEREKRDASRQRNPTGSVWRSARSDAPVNSASYVQQVLKSGRKPGAPEAQQPMRRVAGQPPGAGGLDGGDAARAIQPLLTGAATAAAPPPGPTENGAFAKTKASFEWNPTASFIDLGGGGNDYEDLLGPEGGESHLPPPPAPSGSGGSLLHGTYDEAANAESFADAVRSWRTGGGETASSSTAAACSSGSPCGGSSASGGVQSGRVQTAGQGGSLLDGAFNEDDSAASFAEALNAWRSGDGAANANAGGAAARPSRFTVRGAAAPTSTEPTLADKVHALKSELGLPMDASLVEAVRAANAAVGLDNIGTLADQVGA